MLATMTATADPIEAEVSPRTGHRPGRNPDDPRNSTVCFMVSEHEKAVIDSVGLCTNLRRSAILTRIVTTFLEGVAGDDPELSRKELNAFLRKCREAVAEKPELVAQYFPKKEGG